MPWFIGKTRHHICTWIWPWFLLAHSLLTMCTKQSKKLLELAQRFSVVILKSWWACCILRVREELCSAPRKSPFCNLLVNLSFSDLYAPSLAPCSSASFILRLFWFGHRELFSHSPALLSHSQTITHLKVPAALSFLPLQGRNNPGHTIIVSLSALSGRMFIWLPVNKIHHLISSYLWCYFHMSEKEKVMNGNGC